MEHKTYLWKTWYLRWFLWTRRYEYICTIDKTDDSQAKIIEKEIKFAAGWYKCFDELIVNAHDHKKRMDKTAEDLKGKKHNHKPTHKSIFKKMEVYHFIMTVMVFTLFI